MSNPFPGLRPFQLEESHLFFGREEQTGQLLERLGNTRFLAVVGASGSGKSSLVRAGLLPQLYGGTMVKTSVNWEIAIMRPGGDPITNLARCLVEADIYEDNSEDQVQLLRTMLSRSGLGLLEAYRQSDIEPGTNLLILVDQFEESTLSPALTAANGLTQLRAQPRSAVARCRLALYSSYSTISETTLTSCPFSSTHSCARGNTGRNIPQTKPSRWTSNTTEPSAP